MNTNHVSWPSRWTPSQIAVAEQALELLDDLKAVQQVQVVELLTATLCQRMGTQAETETLLDGMHKHVRQLLDLS